ncbi:MAG: hypothetical protein ACXWC9_08515 [Pseudobdellovibrionaceae bacterium]
MKIGDIRVRYHGFHPSDFTQNLLNCIMQEIYDESPDGSCLKASFTRNKEVLRGIVQVNSPAGPFFASATGTHVNEVAHRLLVQMRRRLDKWKSKRFRHERLRDLFTPINEIQEEGHDSNVA